MAKRVRPVRAALIVGILIALAFLFARLRTHPLSPMSVSNGTSPGRSGGRTSEQFRRPTNQRPPVWLSDRLAPAEAGPVTGVVEGVVHSSLNGQGLSGAILTFSGNEEVSSVTSGLGGAFHFVPPRPGWWQLAAATATGHLPFAPEWGQSPVLFDVKAGGATKGVTIALVPAEEFDGHVVDLQGNPIPGAEITVVGGGAGNSTLVPNWRQYRSNDRGAFRFVAPEDAVVEGRHPGYSTGRANVDFSVQVSRKLTLRLPAASGVRLAIGGAVVDSTESAVDGALVVARPVAGTTGVPVPVYTDASGRFEVRDLEPGKWQLTASRRGAGSAMVEIEAGTSGVQLRLSVGGRISGRVRERDTGRPVQLFTVVVQSTDLRAMTVISPEGLYDLADLQPGPAFVSVVAPGLAPSEERAASIPVLGPNAAIEDFSLSRGGSLSGFVQERGTGRPIAGAHVVVEGTPASAGVPIRNETMTDESGAFVLLGVAENLSGVFVSAQGHHARILSGLTIPDRGARDPIVVELSPVGDGEDPRVELAGIGAMLEKRGHSLRIAGVAPGGGAAEVGLAEGDEVIEIGTLSVQAMGLGDAMAQLRGPEGTSVVLTVVRFKDESRRPVILSVPRRLIRY